MTTSAGNADVTEVATGFLTALAAASQTGEWDSLYAFLAADVNWVTPQRELVGVTEIRREHTWWQPPDKLDLEFERGELIELGDGRLTAEVRQVYTLKATGEFAYERLRRVELTVRDGKVSRYEMRSVG
jgi:ketosteroid isomerase-like protein